MLEKAAFVTLIDQKSEILYRIARTILRNDEDCKDALQETVLKAWENRHKLRDETLAGTWITRILINECRALGRKRRKYVLRADVEVPGSQKPEDPALREALDLMPEKLRLPLVLHYLEGYSYREISTILGVPNTTVRSRLSRARRTMETQLQFEQEAWPHEAQ